MYRCRAPKNKVELEAYYALRWQILREPWQKEKGSEKDDLESQSYHRLVMDEQDTIVGVGRLHLSSQFQGHVRFMAVAKHAQGCGIGQLLLAELENIARKKGIKTLLLNARENALSFYQKLGYEKKGFSHTLYHELKHEKMAKTLVVSNQHLLEKTQQLESIWHQTIPLSKAMNLCIGYYDQQEIITHCDLIFNKNLHNTMFAGSIYTHATLTGWAWVYFALQSQAKAADIVLAEGNIRYIAPLAGVAYARTQLDNISGNFDGFANGKNARFTIKVEVCCGDTVAAIFTGSYVAVLQR